MNAYEAFLNGIKPAYFCDHDDQYFDHLVKSNYPAVPIVKNATLFFESEKSKERFLMDLDGAEPYTRQYFLAVGKALGYPPIATEFFADCTDNPELEKRGAVFEYAGRYFSGHIDDKEHIVKWLWNNVPIRPAPVKITPYNGETFFIEPDSCYINLG